MTECGKNLFNLRLKIRQSEEYGCCQLFEWTISVNDSMTHTSFIPIIYTLSFLYIFIYIVYVCMCVYTVYKTVKQGRTVYKAGASKHFWMPTLHCSCNLSLWNGDWRQ